MKWYLSLVMIECHHSFNIPLHEDFYCHAFGPCSLLISDVFSATAETHILLFYVLLSFMTHIKTEIRVSVIDFGDSPRTRLVTLSLTNFLPKSAPIGTPLRHIFAVTAFLLRKAQLQIGNGPKNRHLSRYLSDLCVFNVIFSLLLPCLPFLQDFRLIHNYFSN